MADERAAEQADGGTAETAETAETAVSQPHDKYFQHVFSNEQDAASLLRTCVPNALADTLKWSTLSLLRGRFVDDDWRRNETDMLYSVERGGYRAGGAGVRTAGASVDAGPVAAVAATRLLRTGLAAVAAAAQR